MSSLSVAISTFGRADTLLNTVSNLQNVSSLINVNDANVVLAKNLQAQGFETVIAEQPQLFWQGMVTLVKHSSTDWILLTSDEDAVIVEELDSLRKFAIQKKAGVVCAPVWNSSLVKPWPNSWIEKLAPTNHYVLIYTVPALVALMGMTRDAYVYPRAVTLFGEQLPGQQEVPGSDYWQQASRHIQREHLANFIDVIREKNPDYAKMLDEAKVYESRGWA